MRATRHVVWWVCGGAKGDDPLLIFVLYFQSIKVFISSLGNTNVNK